MRIIPFRINATKEEDNFSDVYAFLIQGNQKDAYEVEIDIDSLNDIGITDSRCTCPHYTFRASECKHIKECVKILGCFGIKTEFINSANMDEKVENNNNIMDSKVEKDDIQRKSLGIKESGIVQSTHNNQKKKIPTAGDVMVDRIGASVTSGFDSPTSDSPNLNKESKDGS